MTRSVAMGLVCRHLLLVACLLSLTAGAHAHGVSLSATDLLGVSGQGATLVRLTRGLARRSHDGFQFICPEVWGGDLAAPVAATSSGTAFVAAEQLFVVTPDGRVAPHANSPGLGIALASRGNRVFGIFGGESGYSLWRISESESVLVSRLEQRFEQLAVTDDGLALLAWDEGGWTLQRLSLTGEVLEHVSHMAPSGVSRAELRVSAGDVYVVVWGWASPWVTLGRISKGDYEPLVEAGSTIFGPVAVDEGGVLGVDGRLTWLHDGPALEQHGYVGCLGMFAGAPYLCSQGDLMRLASDLETTTLFELGDLTEPDYSGLPDNAQRAACARRWLDIVNDTGIPEVNTGGDSEATMDGGAGAASASMGAAAPAGGCAIGADVVSPGWPLLVGMLLCGYRR